MKVALEVWSSSYEQVLSTCVLAEQLGLDGFYYGESPHDLNLDCWTTLAGLAGATDRIRLGPVITNVLPDYRSLILLAKQAATVATMSRGRVDLRTGAGASAAFARSWWQPFGVTYPNYDERLADLTNALVALPRLWAGKPIEASELASDTDPAPSPRPLAEDLTIPITVAASGERAMTLAAQHGDCWETSFCTPEGYAERNATFTAMAERPVIRSLEIDGFVSQTSRGLNSLLATVRADRGASEDLDQILSRGLVGGPADAAEHLLELQAAGVDQAVVALHDPHDHDALRAIAEAAAMVRANDRSVG